MTHPERPPIIVTRLDGERLERLLDTHACARDRAAVEALEDELRRARVVEPADVPADVVTMRSTVRYRDDETGHEREVTVVYPHEADAAAGRISVLAPIGGALLGLRTGQAIDWPLPGGRQHRLRVVHVASQPEASGRYDR